MHQLLPAALLAVTLAAQGPSPFVEKPYLQLGDNPALSARESLVLMWHASDDSAKWSVQLRGAKSTVWRKTGLPVSQLVQVPGIPAHKVFRTALTDLTPGEEFSYRVYRNEVLAFEAAGKARKSASQPVRFALFGDCGANTPGQLQIANQAFLTKPDFVFIPGDIVYGSGRISEYRDKFYPFYNADKAGPETGAPLLRSIPFIAAPGNHDTALQNFQRYPDALAYFMYWDQPLNGPVRTGASSTSHIMTGEFSPSPVLAAAAQRYPLMANFSFDYGNAHWTVLDSNTYMDWTKPALLDWLRKDLAAAKGAEWRFVAFHHPGFNSSKSHFTDQWMRLLAPVFEEAKVDVVFAGHVHNYQRSFPLTFTPKPRPDGRKMGSKGEVDGDWKLDKEFADGASKKPVGVIYVVSGAGGAGLYDPAQMKEPATWQGFTNKFISDEHSFSQVDINGKTLELKQITASGKTVDSFRIAK